VTISPEGHDDLPRKSFGECFPLADYSFRGCSHDLSGGGEQGEFVVDQHIFLSVVILRGGCVFYIILAFLSCWLMIFTVRISVQAACFFKLPPALRTRWGFIHDFQFKIVDFFRRELARVLDGSPPGASGGGSFAADDVSFWGGSNAKWPVA
jgi:hypothetical protein